MKYLILLLMSCLCFCQEKIDKNKKLVNVALNKEVTYEPKAKERYGFTPSPSFITDGKEVGASLATKGYVIWVKQAPTITIDLGQIYEIGKVKFATSVGGGSKIPLPENIFVYVSDDNENWKYAGDIGGDKHEQNGKYHK